MAILKDLLEASAKDSEPYQFLVGKPISFKDDVFGIEKTFKIKKVVVNKAFTSGHSVNISLFLDGLNATGNLRQDAKTNLKAELLNTAILRANFHGDKLDPQLAKLYMDKYFHPYGDKEVIEELNKILNGRKAAWSESGMQGKNFINVDIG